jgi:polyhydroxyalkanoate synthase
MSDTSTNGQSAIATWSKLIESTMKSVPGAQMSTEDAVGSGKDPWLTLIDQLWQANPYSKLLPIDPAEVTRAFQLMWIDAMTNPGRAWANYTNFVQQYTQLMTATALKFWGQGQNVEPVITPEKGDKRFSAPDWQQNPIFDALKQSYLLAATSLLKTASEVEKLDEHQQRKLVFYLRQFLDAISPSNYPRGNSEWWSELCGWHGASFTGCQGGADQDD